MIEHNLKLLATSDLGGHPNGGEGMAIKVAEDGRRFLYIAHADPPIAFSVLDVTDPRRPNLVWQLRTPHPDVRGNSLAVCDDLLLAAWQVRRPGLEPAGITVFDISDPAAPKEISFFDTSGPHSRGVHLVTFMDGRFAHASTGAADFVPKNPNDDQFYMIIDLADPHRPTEAGRWWIPGQRVGDTEELVRHADPFDCGFRPHHAISRPERPERAYLGYMDGGIVILDISDVAAPKLISRFDYHPPFQGFTHTVLPLHGRDLLVVSEETYDKPGIPWDTYVWLVDVRDESNPIMIATLPTPPGFDGGILSNGARMGAHNIHENEPGPGSAQLQNTVFATWFGAGVRAYDIQDPFRPEELATFIPDTPSGLSSSLINDVLVDDRGVVFTACRGGGGLYVLEYTGTNGLN